eukprot:2551639-Amphidinium_carterae.4
MNELTETLRRSCTLRSLSTAASGEIFFCHAVPVQYAVNVVIRNTFLDVLPERPVSLDGFYEERKVKSAPTSKIDEDPSAVLGGMQDDWGVQLWWGCCTTDFGACMPIPPQGASRRSTYKSS